MAPLRLVLSEFVRLVSRRRFWLLVVVNCAFTGFAVWQMRTTRFPGTPLTAPIAFAESYAGMSLMPIVAPFALGDGLASDRASGYLALQLSRRVSRWLLVIARSVAAVLAGIFAAVLCTIPCGLIAFALYPTGADDPRQAVAFLPELLNASPVLYALVAASIYGLAAGAIATVALAVGAWAKRPVAGSIVAVFLLGLGLLIPVQALNPLERVMFANTWGASWTSPPSMFAYWLAVIALAVLVATLRIGSTEPY